MRRIGFILGSGVSIKAGYDSVQSLTETILRGENIYRHTNGKYYKGEKSCDYVNRITQFINFIFEKLNNFNTKFYIATNSNYEDIYYILRQIHDEIYGEQENLI